MASEPEKTTQHLAEQIRNHEPIEAATLAKGGTLVEHNLPLQPTPFVGREVELATLTERLADLECQLLTLVGPGGIGKTRLAPR